MGPTSSVCVIIWGVFITIFAGAVYGVTTPYYGKKIGDFKTYHHDVVGEVYAVDSKTLHIRNFSYDGEGPDAFFWVGATDKPSPKGIILRDEKGTKNVLQPYRNKDITISLPDDKTLNDIKWLAVWCRSFAANFGEVFIPANFDAPKPQRLEGIVGVQHNTSSGPIVIVDAQTFMVPNFYLDGQAPDAHFWVGKGPKPTADGILVPDENGSIKPLGRYDGQSLVVTLPNDLTVFDIDWLSVWCREFAVDFGHVKIPKNLNVPPSLKMLGVSPQSKLNCEVLSDELGFEVRWAKAGDTVVLQLVSRLASGEYMSFGLSGDDEQSQMIGGDVIVAWIDGVGHGHAIDYFLESKAQCASGRGTCPDYKFVPNTNTVRLLNAAIINGYTMITYQRPLIAVDRLDIPIRRNSSQPIIWAVGPLNSEAEASYHSHRNKANMFIDFGRTPSWNCPAPLSEPQSAPSTPKRQHVPAQASVDRIPVTEKSVEVTSTRAPAPPVTSTPKDVAQPLPVQPVEDAWYIPPIECPEPQDNVFYAQIGPAGGKKGYTSITGHVGWGIAWYINGLLIPEITVVRGKTYTFVVEGGNDPEALARNHPFYITDDPVGGLGSKSLEEQEKVRIYAGVRFNADGEPMPSAAGRLCEWVQKSREPAEAYGSFGEYQRVLELSCDKGQAAVLQWTPDSNTPDLVYYQCYTHRYLGWKIHVVDQCEFDHEFGSSNVHETNVNVMKNQRLAPGNTGRAFPETKVVRVGGTMSSVVETNDSSVQFQALPGFRPVINRAGHIDVVTAGPPVMNGDDGSFVKDPFTSNESIPFHDSFRPGEPQFGGFWASNFGQRFEKIPPVYISKQIVPPVVPKVPSRLGNVYQPDDIAMAAQHPVVFRAPAPADGIPPPPPKLPVPQRPPNGNVIRRRPPVSNNRPPSAISADGTPVSNSDSGTVPAPPPRTQQRPPIADATKSFGPFKGTTPGPIPSSVPHLPQFGPEKRQPPKRMASTSATAEHSILSNVWSIINHEKASELENLRRTATHGTRRARHAEMLTNNNTMVATSAPNNTNGCGTLVATTVYVISLVVVARFFSN